jgi:hypothetical protein
MLIHHAQPTCSPHMIAKHVGINRPACECLRGSQINEDSLMLQLSYEPFQELVRLDQPEQATIRGELVEVIVVASGGRG